MEYGIILFVLLQTALVGILGRELYYLKRALKDKETAVLTLENVVNSKDAQISKVLSQKKSSEVNVGAITENLVPLLAGLPYNSTNMHHLGAPIDYLYFDYDQAEIVFVECKSGNARESKRQKLIKNIIQEGRVRYDLVQITSTGIKVTRKV